MTFHHKRLAVALASGVAGLALMAGSAQAGGFASRLGSTDATAQAWAGSAAAGLGIGGIGVNPAVVTSLDGLNAETGGAGVFPDASLSRTTFNATTAVPGLAGAGILGAVNGVAGAAPQQTGNFATSVLTAGSYFNVQLNKQWYFGLSVTAPFGLGVNYNGNAVFAADRTRARITTVNVQPVLGVKLNDQWSVGFGFQVQWINLTFEQRVSTLAPQLGTGQVTAQDVGIGFTAGVTYEPIKGTQLGIGYRSSIDHSADGRQTFSAAVPGLPGSPGRFPITIDQSTPELVTASIRQTINDKLAVSLTGEWQNWRRVKTLIVGGSPTGSQLALNFNDGWYVALGAEYKLDPKWTVRAGVGYDFSPVSDAVRTLSVPDSDRLILSGGLQYRWSPQITLSAAYTAELFQRAPINGTIRSAIPNLGAFALDYTTRTDVTAHLVSAGLTYRFDPPPAVIEAPLVTK
ncbi:OmpP1/FadL family transporter [Candidatus Raskinella chloraquaticus]|uniref:OmpP1/FadL family transporter n=1 Tax=Candidatus Raskinella chloraquaticus TaxID=1951219 RepID=UPI00366D5968